MTSPEEERTLHLQQSVVFGHMDVQPKASNILPEDAEPEDHIEHHSAETQCLSRTKLRHVAESILENSTLKYLYLAGNQIRNLPDSMFSSLSNLLWLDLRHNQIASLPAEIGSHRSLQTLLLEGNPISELPAELGNVISLKGLNLRNCPISFPPHDIVCEGLQCILQYLRSTLALRPVSRTKTPPASMAISSVEFPVVEKLQLSELVESSMDELDGPVDEEELLLFLELKDKMILLDKAELSGIAQGDIKSCLLPSIEQRKATTKADMNPELTFSDNHWQRKEERRRATSKEKQATYDQRRNNHEVLHKWRSLDKSVHERKSLEQRRHERQAKKQEEARNYSEPGVEDTSGLPQMQTSGASITQCEDASSARKMEWQIHARNDEMKLGCRNPRGSATEQISAADQDVEEIRKLQSKVQERRRGVNAENRFPIYTEDTWSSFFEK